MTVKLHINDQHVTVEPGRSLFDYAEDLGIRVPTSCQKNGKCRECLMEIAEGMDLLTPPTEEEGHLQDNFRLSCRVRLAATQGVVRCHTLRRGELRIIEHSDFLTQTVRAAGLDPAITREGDRVYLDGDQIARHGGPIRGLAIDLGTTTVVARLVNLETGEVEAVHSFENPQRFGGSDVMARIKYDTDHKGKLLQRTLLGYLNHAIEALPCDPQSIFEVTVAGNSTMRDLFFGLNVYSIGQRPYRSSTENEWRDGLRESTAVAVAAKRLRLPICPQARVYGLPLISGHVGADTAACLLAIGMADESRTVAMMDIGTNTELLVGNRERILAASCPAGPAFEGGAIACGMPGLDGAIETIHIKEDGSVRFDVIGQTEALGICGSGLVEILGELLRTGRMNLLGRFENGAHRFDITPTNNLALYEEDISQLAQAKGANVAGLQIVLQNYGIDFDDLDCFYLAGGFARRLNLDAARRIGLIPNLPDEKIIQLGNGSIEGATMALRSVTARRRLEQIVTTIEHVELETDPHFFDYFVNGCQFVPVATTSLTS